MPKTLTRFALITNLRTTAFNERKKLTWMDRMGRIGKLYERAGLKI
jgi:hypothetical protein